MLSNIPKQTKAKAALLYNGTYRELTDSIQILQPEHIFGINRAREKQPIESYEHP